jgi:hypothetical protein
MLNVPYLFHFLVVQAVMEPRNGYDTGLLSKTPEQVQQLLQI